MNPGWHAWRPSWPTRRGHGCWPTCWPASTPAPASWRGLHRSRQPRPAAIWASCWMRGSWCASPEAVTGTTAWPTPKSRMRLRHWPWLPYGHLAGQLGVAVYDALQRGGRLASTCSGFELTDSGRAWLERLGLIPSPPNSRRRFAYRCLDWSERRDHLGGQLADELYQHFTSKGWLRRASGRAVEVTPNGQQELLPQLNDDAA